MWLSLKVSPGVRLLVDYSRSKAAPTRHFLEPPNSSGGTHTPTWEENGRGHKLVRILALTWNYYSLIQFREILQGWGFENKGCSYCRKSPGAMVTFLLKASPCWESGLKTGNENKKELVTEANRPGAQTLRRCASPPIYEAGTSNIV